MGKTERGEKTATNRVGSITYSKVAGCIEGEVRESKLFPLLEGFISLRYMLTHK